MGVVSAGSLRLYGFAEERLIRVMKTSLSPVSGSLLNSGRSHCSDFTSTTRIITRWSPQIILRG